MQAIKARKPVMAVLMSAILPGFGQLYNGKVNKAIWLFMAFAFFSIPWIAVLALYLPDPVIVPLLVLTFVVMAGIWLYGMRDAYKDARQLGDYVPAAWQTGGLYVLVLILCNLIALPVLTAYVRSQLVEPFRIPSVSMEPSIMQGDYLTADKRYNCPSCKLRIERGDAAVFVNPNDRTVLFIKRIIGLPGDRVQISNSRVLVNGIALAVSEADGAGVVTESNGDGRSWQVQWIQDGRAYPAVDVTVPDGEVFVLGDNRNQSQDSRHMGTVPMRDVVGRARQVWFSSGADGIRWDRIGKRVD